MQISVTPFTFHSGIRKWQDVTGKRYVVFTLFRQMGILQKPTYGSYYSKNCLLFTPSFQYITPGKPGDHIQILSFHL
jgi:hypothetical protein